MYVLNRTLIFVETTVLCHFKDLLFLIMRHSEKKFLIFQVVMAVYFVILCMQFSSWSWCKMVRWKFQFGDIFAVYTKHKPFYLWSICLCNGSSNMRTIFFRRCKTWSRTFWEQFLWWYIFIYFVLSCLIANILINLKVTYQGWVQALNLWLSLILFFIVMRSIILNISYRYSDCFRIKTQRWKR